MLWLQLLFSHPTAKLSSKENNLHNTAIQQRLRTSIHLHSSKPYQEQRNQLHIEGFCTTPYPCKPHQIPKQLQGGTFSLLSHMYVHTQSSSTTFISSCTWGAGIYLFPSRLYRSSLCFLITNLRRWKVERNILFSELLQYYFFIKKKNRESAFVFTLPVGKGNLKSRVLKYEQIAS